jgi:outer membrane protein
VNPMKNTIAALLVSFFCLSNSLNAQKIGFIDTQYILENLPEYKSAQQQLDRMSLQWQKEVEAKFAEIDKMYRDFQAEAVLLTDDMRKKREEEIIDKEKAAKEIQKQRFGKGGDLMRRRQELVKPIQDKVFNAVQELAKAKNFAAVLDKAGEANIIYVVPKFDLSDQVLDAMGYTPGKRATQDKGNDTDITVPPSGK